MAVADEERRWSLSAPDGGPTIEVVLSGGGLTYRVVLGDIPVLDRSPLGIATSVADFRRGLTFVGSETEAIDDTYLAVAGKFRRVTNRGRALTLRFRRELYEMSLEVRAYPDAVAYRYVIGGEGTVRVSGEATAFALAGDVRWQTWAQSVSDNYEEFYPLREGPLAGSFNLPLLGHRPGPAWVLLTEAAVYGNYCGSHVEVSDPAGSLLKVAFAADQGGPVVSERPLATPWRVAIVGRDLRTIFESTVVDHLNPASELTDTDWIHPGRVYWSWWAGERQDSYAVQARHVDFAAEMGWEYFLCDAGWQMEWLPRLIEHARSKKVRILVWCHHRDLATDDEREAKLALWASLGVSGVKADFFDSDCQDRIRVYDDLARETAKHHLVLNYHGATKPSGERRRWPHLLTREGILGAEYYRDHPGPTAAHNCTVPFTRNAVGPMDYTPVTYSKIRGQTTITHQVALPIIFESSLQHLSDSIEGFARYGSAAREFFRACPATWDESRLLEGDPGRWVVIARRSGSSWFVGAISALEEARATTVNLGFLGEGPFRLRRLMDDAEGSAVVADEETVTGEGTVSLLLPPRGGAVAWLTPAAKA